MTTSRSVHWPAAPRVEAIILSAIWPLRPAPPGRPWALDASAPEAVGRWSRPASSSGRAGTSIPVWAWEVKYPFFTNQFKQAKLDSGLELNTEIDGITGATLSVRALKKLSRLALYFHQQVTASP